MPTPLEHFLARRTFPPLPAGDSRILLDTLLTSQAAATAAGFILEGSGHVFDALGFNGKGTGNLRMNGWPHSATVAPQGTLYLQCDRLALSWSNANNAGYDGLFHDSSGTDTGAERYLFQSQNGAVNDVRQIFYNGAGAPDQTRFNYVIGGTSQYTDITNLNSHPIPTFQDARYCQIVLTWKDTRWWWWFDGHMIGTGTSAASPASDAFNVFRLGSQGTATKLLGDFYIRRIQISTAYSPPIVCPLRVGGYGDSFALASIEGTVPGSDTVAAINASQFTTSATTPNFGRSRGQASWMHGLRSLAWTDLGILFPYYVSGKQGGGYEKSPIPAAYRDALNAYRPELIIALQSTNDVNPASPATNIVGSTTTMLDALIDGNPSLRTILFVVGISGHQDPAKAAISGWRDEFKRLMGLLEQGLHGYRNKVVVINLYERWGGDDYSRYQTIGSSPDNNVGSAGNDVHPSATGHQKIAGLLWPYIAGFLAGRPTR